MKKDSYTRFQKAQIGTYFIASRSDEIKDGRYHYGLFVKTGDSELTLLNACSPSDVACWNSKPGLRFQTYALLGWNDYDFNETDLTEWDKYIVTVLL